MVAMECSQREERSMAVIFEVEAGVGSRGGLAMARMKGEGAFEGEEVRLFGESLDTWWEVGVQAR